MISWTRSEQLVRRLVGLGAAAAVVAGVAVMAAATTTAESNGRADVVSTLPTPPTLRGDLRRQYLQAERIARRSSDELAGAWVTPSGELMLGVADEATGAPARAQLDAAGLDRARLVPVARSMSQIQEIVDNVYELPGAEAVHTAGHDWPNNRAIVYVEHATSELRELLADVYGSAAVVIVEQPAPDLSLSLLIGSARTRPSRSWPYI